MKSILTAIVIVISLAASGAFGQVQVAPDPVLYTSFQHNLWNDLWEDDFEPGVDFLMATTSVTAEPVSIHRMEWHEGASFLDGIVDAASLTNIVLFDMSWHENGTTSFSSVADDGTVVEGTMTFSTSAFAATISSGESYQPHIFGIIKSVHVVLGDNNGNFSAEYHFISPVGRGVFLQDAQDAAELLAEEILPPPGLLADQNDNCHGIFNSWRQLAFQDYQDDMDDCGFIGGLVAGGLAGAGGLGAFGGGVGFFFGSAPGAAAGTAIGAVLGGIGGGIGGAVYGMTECISDAKKDYRQTYRRHVACLNACMSTGNWSCVY